MQAAGDDVLDTICKSFEAPEVQGNAESFQSEYNMFKCGDLKKNKNSSSLHQSNTANHQGFNNNVAIKANTSQQLSSFSTTENFEEKSSKETFDNFKSSTVKFHRKTLSNEENSSTKDSSYSESFADSSSTLKPNSEKTDEHSEETTEESATDYQTLIKEIGVLQASLKKLKSEIAAAKTRKSSDGTLENLIRTEEKLQESLKEKLQVDKNLSKIFENFENDSQENREKLLNQEVEDIGNDQKAFEKRLREVFQEVDEIEESLDVKGSKKKHNKTLLNEMRDLRREMNKQVMNFETFSKLSMDFLKNKEVDESKIHLVKKKLKKMKSDLKEHSIRIKSFNDEVNKADVSTRPVDEENENLKKELRKKQEKIDQLEKSLESKDRRKRDVNNHAKGKILISNQDLKEENVKVIRKNDRPIKTKNQVMKYLQSFMLKSRKTGDVAEIKESMSDDEARDVDTMIYLMEKYPNLKPHLSASILEIVDVKKNPFSDGSLVLSHDDFNNMQNPKRFKRFKRSLSSSDEEQVKQQIQKIMDTFKNSKLFKNLSEKYTKFLNQPELLNKVFPTLDKHIIQDLKMLMELEERHVYLKPFVAVSVLNVMYNSSNSTNSTNWKNSSKSSNADAKQPSN